MMAQGTNDPKGFGKQNACFRKGREAGGDFGAL